MTTPVTPMQANREKIEHGLLAKFGEAFEKAITQAQAITDPARRALGAARIALEHAVLQTAIEKDMPTQSVAAMLGKASPQQVAHFIKEGRKSVHKTYGVDADAMVAALSAKVANIDLPRGLSQTEAMRELIEQGRGLVQQTVSERFEIRGRFADHGNDRFDYLQVQQSPGATSAREKLHNHMVFVESAIDHAVKSGKLHQNEGQLLKDRVEHQVFTVPAENKLSSQFKQFYEHTGKDLRTEVMADARKITSNKTVAEIAERLHDARERVQQIKSRAER